MADDVVAATAGTSGAAADPIERYLLDLAALLAGPRRVRARVVAEARDGLQDAATRHTCLGLPPDQAARAAIGEFGSPPTMASAFASELGTVAARHTLWTFLLTGPLVGIWWLLLLAPRPWRSDPARLSAVGLSAAVPVLPLVAVAVAASLAILATTGSLTRWLPEPSPARALEFAAAVGATCIVGDLAVLAVLVARSVGAAAALSPALSAVAVTASLTRIFIAGRSIQASLRSRAPLVDPGHSGAGR